VARCAGIVTHYVQVGHHESFYEETVRRCVIRLGRNPIDNGNFTDDGEHDYSGWFGCGLSTACWRAVAAEGIDGDCWMAIAAGGVGSDDALLPLGGTFMRGVQRPACLRKWLTSFSG
jgi:hypothetical protein